MEKQEKEINKKGGRPRKAMRKSYGLTVKCSLLEKTAIQGRAKSVGLPVSEYLRTLGLTGKIDRLTKVLPKEVLQLSGTLNHLAANMNQVAKKRNSNEELNEIERARLQVEANEIKQLAQAIKNYIQ